MTSNDSSIDVAQCPLCGRANECQLCTVAAYKGPCWCAKVTIPEALLARIPAELRNKACVCRECVMEFHRAKEGGVAASRWTKPFFSHARAGLKFLPCEKTGFMKFPARTSCSRVSGWFMVLI